METHFLNNCFQNFDMFLWPLQSFCSALLDYLSSDHVLPLITAPLQWSATTSQVHPIFIMMYLVLCNPFGADVSRSHLAASILRLFATAGARAARGGRPMWSSTTTGKSGFSVIVSFYHFVLCLYRPTNSIHSGCACYEHHNIQCCSWTLIY